MPRNLEVKAKITTIESARVLAESIHANYAGTLHQTDTYFRVSNGRLKLREINGTHAELIRYEREESSSRRESRFDVCPIKNLDGIKSLLRVACGVRGVVEKTRILYLLDGSTRIHLDEVKDLGVFLEFEVPVAKEEEASEQLEFLIKHFGIQQSDFVKNSYIDMLPQRGESSSENV
ncbi:MAG TPA: class IV adenylate cyclase [Bacteroidota bacterium]|nr:class IV adenylate cyclase [Bacteroidota bacterium]